jgi:hypothetical protein
MRPVRGRRGQRYLLCGNENVEAKYPPQPVRACHGYTPEAEPRRDPDLGPYGEPG